MKGGAPTGRGLLAASLALVAVVTLAPAPEIRFDREWCVVCGTHATADALLNLALFVPLGFALRRAIPRRTATLWLAGTALSVGIELVQLLLPGRLTTVADVVANSAGVLAGLRLASLATRGAMDRTRAARLSLWAGLLAATLTVGTPLALRPDLPRSTWYGQWTPDLGHLERYEGRVLEARLDGLELPGRRLPDGGAEARRRLLSGTPLLVRFTTGPPPTSLASVFSLYDERQREMLLVGVDRHRLLVRTRRTASDLRLREPAAGAPLRAGTGDTVDVALRLEARGLRLSAPGLTRREPWATPGRGWSLLLPFAPPPGPADAAWLALLWLPIGFGEPRTPAGRVGLAAAALAVLAVAAWTAAPVVAWSLVGALTGLFGGRTLARRFSSPR